MGKIKINKVTGDKENTLNVLVDLFVAFVNKEEGKVIIKPKL